MRYWLWQAGGFGASLIGAVLLAALLATLSHSQHGFWSFTSAFLAHAAEVFSGSFGISAATGHSAMAEAARKLGATLQLVGAGAAVALLIGLPLGLVLSASRLLRAAAPLMQIVAATPIFVVALGLIWICVRLFHWQDTSLVSANFRDWNTALRSFAMPAVIVGLAGAACVQLALRNGAAAVREAPYRNGLRMMGLGAWDIDLRYTLPEVLAAVLQDLGDIALALISAAAVSEWVFYRDGVAALFLRSVNAGDWNVAACVLLIFAIIKLTADFIGLVGARLLAPESAP